MVMTSVSGHLAQYEFGEKYQNWQSCEPKELFSCAIKKNILQNMEHVTENLTTLSTRAIALVIWTDCDREGENIGIQIVDLCRSQNPNLRIYRAFFSEISKESCGTALYCATTPDHCLSNAAETRQILDLRIGIAFTRRQTQSV
jgi:DNA topoisomerase-3